MRNIYQMYKYDNTLYLLPLTGQQIKDVLEFNAQNRLSASVSGSAVSYSTIGDDFTNPIFYGLNFQYDMAKDPGQRVIISGFANGNVFDLTKTYVLAVNNYHLGNGPFAAYSTADAIWSQTDDLEGGVVQDLIAEYVSSETAENGGVSPADSNWSLTYNGSLESGLDDTAYVAYKATAAPADGDTVIICYDAAGTVVSGTAAGTRLAPAAVTLDGSKVLYADDAAAAFLVDFDESTGYYKFSSGGKYLTSGPTGNSLSLTDTDTEYSLWAVEANGDGWIVENVNAVYSGKPQCLEFYSGGFTTYGYNAAYHSAYIYSFFTVVPTAELMTAAPADGDQFVIWYNAGKQIIASSPIPGGGRLDGVNSETVGDLLPAYEGSGVFTADLDEESGYWYYTCDGRYLTSGPTGNAMSLTDAPDANGCSLWEPKPTEGGWLVRNVGAEYGGQHEQHLEYYYGFTTYGLSSNLSRYTYNFYAFDGFAPAAPSDNLDQEAPTGLAGVAPTTAANSDGQITGTTAEMEHRLSSESGWTACTGTSVTDLFPGSYLVRFAAKEGYNPSPATTVAVPAYGKPGEAQIIDIALNIGADETERLVTWYSDAAGAGEVQLAPAAAMTGDEFPSSPASFPAVKAASAVSGFSTFKATVTGLESGTEYVYRVGGDDGWSDVYTLSVGDLGDESFSFLLAGDPQIGCSGSTRNDTNGWTTTLSSAASWFSGTDFLLSVGDQVEHNTNETEYLGLLAPGVLCSLTLATNIGNHDTAAVNYKQHFSVPNPGPDNGNVSGGDYWYSYENVLFMGIDSNNMSTALHKDFLEGAIAAYKAQNGGQEPLWKIVTFHHSVYSVADHTADDDILLRRGELPVVFAELGIDAVLMGHDHSYTRSFMMEGTTPITTGYTAGGGDEYAAYTDDPTRSEAIYMTVNSASGSKYYPLTPGDYPFAAVKNQENTPNITKVDVDADSLTFATYRTGAGNTVSDALDTFTLQKAPEAPETFAVTFDCQGGSVVENQTVENDGLVTEPAAPTKDGYTFGGWFKEAACTNAWDFATDKVTADTILYAKWTEVPVAAAPTELKAELQYGKNRQPSAVKLSWKYDSAAPAIPFAIYAGYGKDKLVKVAEVENALTATLDVKDLEKALKKAGKPKGKDNHKPGAKGKDNKKGGKGCGNGGGNDNPMVYFKVTTAGGSSNVVSVKLEPKKIKPVPPKQCKGEVSYDKNRRPCSVKLSWKCDAPAGEIPGFSIWAGYNANQLMKVKDLEDVLSCTLDVKDLEKALSGLKKPGGNSNVIIKIGNTAGSGSISVNLGNKK